MNSVRLCKTIRGVPSLSDAESRVSFESSLPVRIFVQELSAGNPCPEECPFIAQVTLSGRESESLRVRHKANEFNGVQRSLSVTRRDFQETVRLRVYLRQCCSTAEKKMVTNGNTCLKQIVPDFHM